jgi:hypothetical protein
LPCRKEVADTTVLLGEAVKRGITVEGWRVGEGGIRSAHVCLVGFCSEYVSALLVLVLVSSVAVSVKKSVKV